MPKRKRSDDAPIKSKPLNTPARQKKLCTERITTAQKPLLAALRLGAGFERQKHSRRKKTAQTKKNTKAIERLDAEYVVLKGLEMEKLADQHLRKTLGKVKSLKDAEALQEYVAGTEKSNVDSSTLNVTARLFKVPAVKKVVDEVIEDLKGILGVGGVEKAQVEKTVDVKKAKGEKTLKNEDAEMLDVSDEEGDPYNIFSARIAAPSSGEEDSEGSVLDGERPPSIGDSDSEHDPEDDLEAEESESEAVSLEDFGGDVIKNYKSKLNLAVAAPSDLSEDSSSESDSDEPAAPAKRMKVKVSKTLDTTSSAFLPALSHAAYFSGSESEASDLDVEVAPRKNRRGQRARQKIAEAKFGAGAKHMEKARNNKGWDPKRGAVDEERRLRGEGRNPVPKGRGPQQSGTNAEPLGARKGASVKPERDDKGVLHPSWQAAKAVKESKKLKIDIGGSKAAGKKVVFD